ncbi:aldo/keto reductase [Gellertiella hungarica]|uniref:Putative oxidoreductase n=1 Tax=Gellertiella hungarica TaxID=1572859 RepID=A0A7W6J7W5_9HYPH|nr:aldo/keto reductase [Gellertiella hungarica]MBB4066439.1 putative oxidoreductase [Gellertiella hungarica]
MKRLSIGRTGLEASSIVLGMMRIETLRDAEIDRLVRSALEAGINVIDHADIYGNQRHGCEARFGAAVKLTPSERDRVVLQSKAGIRDGYFDFSARHLTESVEGSLAALRTDYLDLFLLHRPDALMEPEEVALAFDSLHASGKVRHFGVSNHSAAQIELLRTAVRQPLSVNQVQLSVAHAPLIAAGLALNMQGLDQSVDRTGSLLDRSRREGMTLQCWSPFQKGFFEGTFIGDREGYPLLNDALEELAARHGITPTGVAVAWITRHPARMQVVVGSTRPERVRECVAGAGIELTREEWYRLFRAAGHVLP